MSRSARRRPVLARVMLGSMLLLVAGLAGAAMPLELARAFRREGIPLDAVSVVVQEVGGTRPLVAHRAGAAMSPASVMKIVTTYAALDLLGPNYRWRTEAYATGTIDNGTLHGDLVLRGRGDPKITIEQWQSFMAMLVARGIRRIDGDLVLDRSAFDLPPHQPGAFDGEPLRSYNVGPDALLVSFKSVELRFTPGDAGAVTVAAEPPLASVHLLNAPAAAAGPCGAWRERLQTAVTDRGSTADVAFTGTYALSCGERSWYVALLDAPSFAHAMFATYFARAGGTFTGAWHAGKAPPGAAPIAVLDSPPLYDIVRDINKLSNNVMARNVFLTLALEQDSAPATTKRAADVVRRWARARRLSLPGLVLENGSGLSRQERITAGGLVTLLMAADSGPLRNDFASSLAVAATDGTVENRFLDQRVAGQALLKTGTLEGVRALAGYVIDRQGRRFALAAIINHPNAVRGQPPLDAVVQWVYAHGAAYAPITP